MRHTFVSEWFTAIVLLMGTLHGVDVGAQETSTALPGSPGAPPAPENAIGPESSVDELISALRTSTDDNQMAIFEELKKRGPDATMAIPVLLTLSETGKIPIFQTFSTLEAICVGADPGCQQVQFVIDWLMGKIRDEGQSRSQIAERAAVVVGKMGRLAERAAPGLYDFVRVRAMNVSPENLICSYESDSSIVAPLKVAAPDTERIVSLLNDPHSNVRNAAIFILDAARYLMSDPFTGSYSRNLPDFERCLAVTWELGTYDTEDDRPVVMSHSQIVEALSDPMPYVRYCALQMLDASQFTGDDLSLVLNALRDDDEGVRNRAANQLIRATLTDANALESLRKAIDDPSLTVAALAAIALAHSWPSDDSARIALDTVDRCSQIGPLDYQLRYLYYNNVRLGPKTIERLVSITDNNDSQGAASPKDWQVWKYPGPIAVDPAAIPTIVTAMQTLKDERRTIFTQALVASGTPSIPIIVNLMANSDEKFQKDFANGIIDWVECIGKSPVDRAWVNAYMMELNTHELPNRIQYAVLLALIDTGYDLPKTKEILNDALSKVDYELQIRLIGKLKRRDHLDDYKPLVRDVSLQWIKSDDPKCRLNAAYSLLDDPETGSEAIQVLLEALKNSDENTQRQILNEMAATGVPSATHEVMAVTLNYFQNGPKDNKFYCTDIWSKLGPAAAEALPLLQKALNECDPPLKPRVARAMVSIDPKLKEPALALQQSFSHGDGTAFSSVTSVLIDLTESGWLLENERYQFYVPTLLERARTGNVLAFMFLSKLTPAREQFLPVLIELTKSPDWLVRKQAREMLERFQNAADS